MTVQRRHLYIILAVSVVGVPLAACGDAAGPATQQPGPGATAPGGGTTDPGPDPTAIPTGTPTVAPTTTGTGPRNVEGVVIPSRPAYQTKSSAQLRKSIINCFGTNSTQVTAGMFQGGPTPNAGGNFFTAGSFAVGDDIVTVDKQARLFDGDADALKIGVRADQLTLEYLTALRNVANVVGFRCLNGLVDNPAMCQCNDGASAAQLLQRCIGDVVPPTTTDFANLASSMVTCCNSGTGCPVDAANPTSAANSRATLTVAGNPVGVSGVAVASLVSSLTFAKLP